MFVPPHYRPDAPEWARDLIASHPLALLVTQGESGPFATHLPVIPSGNCLDHGTGETGLVGVELLGHMNRANPHWAALAAGEPGVLVFSGPNAYVSPPVYQTQQAAPTWNFVSVHAHGTPEPLGSVEETLGVVRATVAVFERDHGTGWDMTDSLGYFEQIVAGVGAFRFRVTAAEGMFKLSQDKPRPVRTAIADAFAAGSPRTRQVADTMRRLGVAGPAGSAGSGGDTVGPT